MDQPEAQGPPPPITINDDGIKLIDIEDKVEYDEDHWDNMWGKMNDEYI